MIRQLGGYCCASGCHDVWRNVRVVVCHEGAISAQADVLQDYLCVWPRMSWRATWVLRAGA